MMDPAKSILKGAVVLVKNEGGIHEIGKNILVGFYQQQVGRLSISV